MNAGIWNEISTIISLLIFTTEIFSALQNILVLFQLLTKMTDMLEINLLERVDFIIFFSYCVLLLDRILQRAVI